MGKVTIRKKPISKGRQTLYLDFYPPVQNPDTGKQQRRYYLKIYIYSKPKTELEKEHNRETLSLAEHVRSKRQLDVQNKRFDFLSDAKRNGNFLDFFQELADKRSGTNSYNWKMSVAYFIAFAGEVFPFAYLNETFCEGYSAYLLSSPSVGRAKRKIKTNTAVSYFAKFKTTLKEAYKKGYLPKDLGRIVDGITPIDTHREFLFMDELQNMADAECESKVVKRAGLFSALTGFRFSDIQTLLWSEIRGAKGNYIILYAQEKTAAAEYFPVSDQAVALLGVPGSPNERVFKDLDYNQVDTLLPGWLINAGINRHFTFHGFRHTFATLQIASGTSIYTVSKLLGHKSVKTTEIYARIVDSLKKEATERIRLNSLTLDAMIKKE
ncbi:site-specific integrase [Chryseobacterium herbae]|uniref:Site-specific integrase n=1 Tax=Chryseobacterium herbae TaxID=2976476 RepID=A0ABT2ISE4_9FLAO|nr:site-specific integrase [Chryseobacterium sp. pc1-10]MCT2561759.1 site-specific integrase [Chryseobacterium sp. pc1-10]